MKYEFRLVYLFIKAFLFLCFKVTYIKMDDIAHGIKHPAVIDFKIGNNTVGGHGGDYFLNCGLISLCHYTNPDVSAV